jgi:hypothetical protein
MRFSFFRTCRGCGFLPALPGSYWCAVCAVT